MEPFVALMRRYCLDYTNRHDVSVCEEIMEPNYELRMGQYVLTGRDDKYIPAAQAQFKQFPGLCLTVHQIVTNGDRLAMRFSEHGASIKHANQVASWSGIGLYQWNGKRLVRNFVEQDYYSRRFQLDGAEADPVETPALDPWGTTAGKSNVEAESTMRTYLSSFDVATTILNVDDAWLHPSAQPMFSQSTVTVDDLFSAGSDVAFRVTISGVFEGGLADADAHRGAMAEHFCVGVASVVDGKVVSGRVITDRLGLVRRLGASS